MNEVQSTGGRDQTRHRLRCTAGKEPNSAKTQGPAKLILWKGTRCNQVNALNIDEELSECSWFFMNAKRENSVCKLMEKGRACAAPCRKAAYMLSMSPTRNILPDSVGATRVLVARR